jgi:hypothetical protein
MVFSMWRRAATVSRLALSPDANRVAGFIDRPIQILPFALDAELRLVHAPAFADRALAKTERPLKYWQRFTGPASSSDQLSCNFVPRNSIAHLLLRHNPIGQVRCAGFNMCSSVQFMESFAPSKARVIAQLERNYIERILGCIADNI